MSDPGKMGSPLKWFGGKSFLGPKIVNRIPAHITYAEPFFGAGHVLFTKPPSPVEIANDINNNLINLWLCIRDRLDEFREYLDSLPISESLFYEFAGSLGYSNDGRLRYSTSGSQKSIHHPGRQGIPSLEQGNTTWRPRGAEKGIPDAESGAARKGIPDVDLKRAVQYYYLIRGSWNGVVRNGTSFSISPGKRITFRRDDWDQIKDRLKDVIFLKRDFSEIIKKYDSPETFFYFDPPYICTRGHSDYYEHNLTYKQHQDLASILKRLRGSFLLSMDNSEEATQLYGEFPYDQVRVPYSDQGELLIRNYDLPEKPFYYPGNNGIPILQISEGYATPRSSSFKIPNCPFCMSRKVQHFYLRRTIIRENGSKARTYTPKNNVLWCENCRKPFQGVDSD